MNDRNLDNFRKYVSDNREDLIDLIMKVASIVSMTGKEDEKARFVLKYLKDNNAQDVHIDGAGNVIYLHGGTDSDKANEGVAYAAHIDTVFKDTFSITPIREGGKILAPSIADNSANVAAILFLAAALNRFGIRGRYPVYFVFDTGEEGLGNLKGIKHFVDTHRDRIKEVIALDGGYDTIVTKGVGSIRYRVEVSAQGGHSYSAFGNKSAIHYVSQIVNDLYGLSVPREPRTTYNAGLIGGGTSVNTIAQEAFVEIDLRSVDESCLEKLNGDFLDIVDRVRSQGVEAAVILTGRRPGGVTPKDSPLVKRIIKVREEMGLKTRFQSSSTDANYPMSLGIDAVTFGVCVGEKCHTLDEYLIEDSLEDGMAHLVNVFLREGGFM